MSAYEEFHFYVCYYLLGRGWLFAFVKCFTNEAWYDLCEKTAVHVGFDREYKCTWEATSRTVRL